MASAILSGWPNGATVSAYVAPTTVSGTPDTDALGSAVTSATANTAGQVTLTGLTSNQAYIASDGTTRRRFIAGSGPTSVLRNLDRDVGQPGMYGVSAPGWFWQTLTAVASRGYIARFVPSRDMTIANIAIAVSTAASVDDPVDVGIYDASLNRLGSSGATLGKLNSPNTKSIALTAPVSLKAGSVYYAALSFGTVGGTAAVISGGSFGAPQFTKMFGTAVPAVEIDVKAAMHPLPTSWGALGTLASQFSVLALLEA